MSTLKYNLIKQILKIKKKKSLGLLAKRRIKKMRLASDCSITIHWKEVQHFRKVKDRKQAFIKRYSKGTVQEARNLEILKIRS